MHAMTKKLIKMLTQHNTALNQYFKILQKKALKTTNFTINPVILK